MGNPVQSYVMSPAVMADKRWAHIAGDLLLPSDALTATRQAGTRFTYPDGWKAELG